MSKEDLDNSVYRMDSTHHDQLDDESLTLLLRDAVGECVSQLRQADPTMSEEEAENIAAETMLESLCSERIDIRSRVEVEGWCQRFRGPRESRADVN